MDQYSKVLGKFESLGFTLKTTFSYKAMRDILDNIASVNTNSKFDPTIAEEIWEETPKLGDSKISMHDLVTTITHGL